MTEKAWRFAPPCGPVDGRRDGNVVRVTAIPYATAARFHAPQQPPIWDTPRPAQEWGASCPQPSTPEEFALLGMPTRTLRTDEECLNLSVTVPADIVVDERLPVLVWIHGGSYLGGAGDDEFNDPANLVAEQRIVAVSVTYRLGVFGYLAGDGRPANLGLLDQLAALAWVRENIAAFGGDPEEVTLGGQSAGADAVIRVLLTKDGGASVRRAVIQSAPLGILFGRERLDAALDARIGPLSPDASAEDLLAVGDTVYAVASPFGLRGQMPFSPRWGADPLPAESDVAATWRETASHVDILIGTTRRETSFFVPALPKAVRVAALPVVGRLFEAAFVAATTERLYGRGTRRFAAAHRRAGGSAVRYVFTWAAPGNRFGAAHAVDLALLFGADGLPGGAAENAPLLRGATREQLEAVGRELRSIWGTFIRGEQPPRDAGRGIITFRGTRRAKRSAGITPLTSVVRQ